MLYPLSYEGVRPHPSWRWVCGLLTARLVRRQRARSVP